MRKASMTITLEETADGNHVVIEYGNDGKMTERKFPFTASGNVRADVREFISNTAMDVFIPHWNKEKAE